MIENVFLMDNTIQDYEWGSKEAIGYLFGLSNPNNKPMAEIWMGAHPKASSAIMVEGQQLSLNTYINAHKEEVVGRQTYQRFGELPYLFKVLSAGKALSIQVHPSKSQAEAALPVKMNRVFLWRQLIASTKIVTTSQKSSMP